MQGVLRLAGEVAPPDASPGDELEPAGRGSEAPFGATPGADNDFEASDVGGLPGGGALAERAAGGQGEPAGVGLDDHAPGQPVGGDEHHAHGYGGDDCVGESTSRVRDERHGDDDERVGGGGRPARRVSRRAPDQG